MVGGLAGHQQQPLAREQLEQIVQVAEELGAGGVLKDLVEALAAGDVDRAEQPAGVERQLNKPKTVSLSKAALEVLAIVAVANQV